MVKMKVVELSGSQLDWAVAKALGLLGSEDDEEAVPGKLYWCGTASEPRGAMPRHYVGPSQINPDTGFHFGWFRPSTSGDHGVPIIDGYAIQLEPGRQWMARTDGKQGADKYAEATGPSSLIAAMRALVASFLGEEIEVPEVTGQ